jgi:hypothetical protein
MVKFVSKDDSRVMKLIGLLRPDFTKTYWTTVGNTIYYPTNVKDPYHKCHSDTVKHELVHVEQYRKLSVPLFLFLYLFVPFPVFFSYFRWRFEREAYLTQIRAGALTENVVQALWNGYLFPWPRFLMRRWFNRQFIEK